MKADEAVRYLGYLSYETQHLAPVPRTRHLSRKRLLIFVVVLCTLTLVVVGGYALPAGKSSAVLAQPQQSISKDFNTADSMTPERTLLRANGPGSEFISSYSRCTSCWFKPPRITPCCVGPWYVLVTGLLACPGG